MSEVHSNGSSSFFVTAKSLVEFKKTKAPVTTVEQQTAGAKQWIPWGTDNLFLQRVAEECRKSTIIPPVLNKVAQMLYSGGMTFGTLSDGPTGEEKFTSQIFADKEVRAHLRRLNFERYHMEASLQLVWSWAVFVEIILSNDRSKIMNLKVHPSRECRFEWPNSSGKIKNVWVNANWATDTSGVLAKQVPFIDIDYDPVTAIREASGTNFMICLQLPDFDNKYYKLAPWDGARQSGWLDLALKIPTFKKALLANQMTIKYHIKVTDEYMAWKYPGYSEMADKDKVEKQKALVSEFNNLKGEEQAGKALLSITHLLPDGETVPGMTIEPIDDKIKNGIYIEDSQEASSHLLFAVDFDGTLMGVSPGKGIGATGSDKGMAYNIKTSTNRPWQDLLNQPFGLMRDYNGWNEDYVFRMRNTLMVTQSNRQQTQTLPE